MTDDDRRAGKPQQLGAALGSSLLILAGLLLLFR